MGRVVNLISLSVQGPVETIQAIQHKYTQLSDTACPLCLNSPDKGMLKGKCYDWCKNVIFRAFLCPAKSWQCKSQWGEETVKDLVVSMHPTVINAQFRTNGIPIAFMQNAGKIYPDLVFTAFHSPGKLLQAEKTVFDPVSGQMTRGIYPEHLSDKSILIAQYKAGKCLYTYFDREGLFDRLGHKLITPDKDPKGLLQVYDECQQIYNTELQTAFGKFIDMVPEAQDFDTTTALVVPCIKPSDVRGIDAYYFNEEGKRVDLN